jgi:hypothetical protein
MIIIIALAYVGVCVGGWLAVGAALYVMRRLLGLRTASFALLDLFVGSAERAVALTLVLWAPPNLATFIGGWVLLKFAIGWQRQPKGDAVVEQSSLLALIGNVLSFAIAIAVGLYLNRAALAALATR